MTHDFDQVCACVKTHNPKIEELDKHHIHPLGWGGLDVESNIVWVCPNAHRMIHILLRRYVTYSGNVPWFIQREFSPFTRSLAKRGWDAEQAQTQGGKISRLGGIL